MARHSSGPIPAGSPEVSATRGLAASAMARSELGTQSLVSRRRRHAGGATITRFPRRPCWRGWRRSRGGAGARRCCRMPVAQQLGDVPAVLGVEGLADLAFLQFGDGLPRTRARNVPGPVQPRSPPLAASPDPRRSIWASPAKSSPFRMRSRSCSSFWLDGGVVRQLRWSSSGCGGRAPGPRLLSCCAADFVQLDDVKAGRGAQGLARPHPA